MLVHAGYVVDAMAACRGTCKRHYIPSPTFTSSYGLLIICIVISFSLRELGSKTKLPFIPVDLPTPQNTCMADESIPPVGGPETHTGMCDQHTVSADTPNVLKPRTDTATGPIAEVPHPSTELAQEVEVGRGDGVDEVVQQVEDVCVSGGGGEQWGGEGEGETGGGVDEGGGQGENEEDETVREKPLELGSDLTKDEDTTPQDPVKGFACHFSRICVSLVLHQCTYTHCYPYSNG